MTDRSGSGSAALAYCERYDPGTGTWAATAAFAAPRAGHQLTPLPDGSVPVQPGYRRALPPWPGHLDPRTGHAVRPLGTIRTGPSTPSGAITD
ncbi:hypothetical protein [Streptomyces sp. NPDC002122]|uniref:hypothetical protein n=1 Tax=Streptomyces sp. NPDC002122 TaxID=3154407 RepID=UPI00332BA5E0